MTKTRPTNVESLAHAIVMKKDNLFFLAQPDGCVPMTGNHGFGLYYHDCRYLNGYELKLGGLAPVGLSASAAVGAVGIFALTNPELEMPNGEKIPKEELGLTWHRVLAAETPALLDELRFENFSLQPVQFSIILSFRSAFEDVYVVRDLTKPRRGESERPQWQGDVLRLAYHGQDRITRALSIQSDPAPDERREASATFHIALAPSQRHTVRVSLTVHESKSAGHASPRSRPAGTAHRASDVARHAKGSTDDITRISGDGSALDQLMDRSFRGLDVLRSHLDGDEYFAAGVPWFVTLFGRDSLVTALQMLPYDSGIAEQTLRLLAKYQGRREDDERDEQPGKILHELRMGELANLKAIPQTPSYSTVDATPLFLIVLAHHARWTGSLRLFEDLRPHVILALEWIDACLRRYPGSYLAYRSETGKGMKLANKGWKDSGNAIVNVDGTLAKPPVALVEVQGYVYAAWLGIASLLDRSGATTQAGHLRQQAEQLKARFNRDYWMEEKGCYALALQDNGRPAAVISSNPGQALWTGIAEEGHARRTIDRLMAPDMFSGWGVRTLSHKERAFNPIGYHLGTVWPHDNSLVAAGFRRYGGDQEALRIFQGLFDAAFHFHLHQLPEVFCGYGREAYEIPINYPVACHPQAWAAGALPSLVGTLLGLEPEAFDQRLDIVRPLLPRGLDRLNVTRLRVGQAVVDLTFRRGKQGVEVDVDKLDGKLDVQVHRS
ncbi:MAG TPA: glycogen debranching N-terminal domain-containing protein [Nitrospira sp.]|nr:glycogen debranching N-terminal domain-containing protein [Nitrospira sp.]